MTVENFSAFPAFARAHVGSVPAAATLHYSYADHQSSVRRCHPSEGVPSNRLRSGLPLHFPGNAPFAAHLQCRQHHRSELGHQRLGKCLPTNGLSLRILPGIIFMVRTSWTPINEGVWFGGATRKDVCH